MRAALFSLLVAAPALALGPVCYSSKSAFSTNPPAGWVADLEAAKRLGFCVVYYPQEYSYDSTPVVIYASLADYFEKRAGALDLKGFVADSVETLRRRNHGLRVKALKDLRTASGLVFVLREFRGGESPNELEEAGYLPAKEAVFMAVFSARKQADFERWRPVFAKFLGSVTPASRGATAP
jgi:hypothetical protein